MKKVCLSILLLCVAFVLPASAERPLRIVAEDWPPFEFKDAKGKVVGMDIDIANAIFKKMGIEAEFLILPWDTAWKMVEEGRADACLSTARKDDRIPYLYYPEEDMWTGEFVFFGRKDAMDSPISAYGDVKGKSVATVKGNVYDEGFTGAGLKTVPVKTLKHQFKKVASRKLDLAFAEKTIGQYSLKIWNMGKVIGPYEHVFYTRGVPMPFAKKSDYPGLKAIADRFEAELKNLKASGEYDTIKANWTK